MTSASVSPTHIAEFAEQQVLLGHDAAAGSPARAGRKKIETVVITNTIG